MTVEPRQRQRPTEIVDVSAWRVDPDHPHYPEGKQPKKLLIAPDAGLPAFLVPGHKYLFKMPGGWQARQIWSELIAYEVSRAVGVPVPPCFLAVDARTGQWGVLMEFFYGHPGEAPLRFVPGSDFLHAWLKSDYDRKRGRPHDVRSNLTVTRSLGVNDPKAWWARTFAFDAMIGNGDRHPDNWGLLGRLIGDTHYDFAMAPLFDNGSSLSYGETDERLARLGDLDAYIRKGRHHCALGAAHPNGSPHLDLCADYARVHDPTGAGRDVVGRFSDQVIDDVLSWCLGFEGDPPFTEIRAAFLRSLLIRRRQLLMAS